MLFTIVGGAVCWALAVILALVYPLDERGRVAIGGKIEPLASSWLSALVSLIGLIAVAWLADWHPGAPLLVAGVGLMMLPRLPRGRCRSRDWHRRNGG